MDIGDLLIRSTPEIKNIFQTLRNLIFQKLPSAYEEVDLKAGMTAYMIFPGYAGTIFTLIIAEKWITMGFPYGSSLSDPEHLLAGNGKVHKSIRFLNLSLVNSPGLGLLMDSAILAGKSRQLEKGKNNVG